MDFIQEEIEAYCEKHTDAENDILFALSRETHAKYLYSRMLSGHLQGAFLKMISHIVRPQKILEIGTYTGYSALCLAEGLQENGILHTIEKNFELEDIIKKYIHKANFEDRIELMIGDAMEVIPQLNHTYELVFIDADKENYINYFNMIVPIMNKGGIILSDNVLWSGKVLEELNPKDISTKILLEYNQIVNNDERVETVLLPIRDGLTVSRVL